MRDIVMDMHRVDQRDQHVDIKQEGTQCDSSRKALTTSSVTGPALAAMESGLVVSDEALGEIA